MILLCAVHRFDAVTSIPLSYLDLMSYLVSLCYQAARATFDVDSMVHLHCNKSPFFQSCPNPRHNHIHSTHRYDRSSVLCLSSTAGAISRGQITPDCCESSRFFGSKQNSQVYHTCLQKWSPVLGPLAAVQQYSLDLDAFSFN